MSNPSPQDIRDALTALVATLTTANGYTTNIPSDHIFKVYDKKKIEDRSDSSYPKAIVLIDAGDQSKHPGSQLHKEVDFLVIFVGKQISSTPDPETTEEIALSFIKDFNKAVLRNTTLGGKIFDLDVTHWTTSSGFTFPEAACICRVKATQEGVYDGDIG